MLPPFVEQFLNVPDPPPTTRPIPPRPDGSYADNRAAWDAYYETYYANEDWTSDHEEKVIQAEVLAAQPFDEAIGFLAAADPTWKTEAVVAIARLLRLNPDPQVLPVLADALDDAGCDDPRWAVYLRSGTARRPEAAAVGCLLLGGEFSAAVLYLQQQAKGLELSYNALVDIGIYVNTDEGQWSLVRHGTTDWRDMFYHTSTCKAFWGAWGLVTAETPTKLDRTPFGCSC